MIAKCHKCGHFTPYLLNDITDSTSKLSQLDIFGNEEPVVVGIVRCNNCGENIAVKSRNETINELKSKLQE